MKKTKILFVLSNPVDPLNPNQARLYLDEEIRAIKIAVATAIHRDFIEIETLEAARPGDLFDKLNKYEPDVLHFSGHGSKDGHLVFCNEQGQDFFVSKENLQGLFSVAASSVQIGFFSACYSESVAETVVQSVPCAIGMNTVVGDDLAITFSARFYNALASGKNVQIAFEQAKLALGMGIGIQPGTGQVSEKIPQLKTKAGIDASHIFPLEGNYEAHITHFSFVEEGIIVAEGDSERGYKADNISCTYSPTYVKIPEDIIGIRNKIAAQEEKKALAGEDSQWNGPTLALRGFGCSRTPKDEDMVLRLRFGPSDWFTHRAAGLSLDSKEDIVYDEENTLVTLREKYLGSDKFDWRRPDLQPEPAFTNTFAIAMCLVTGDNKIVMVQRSSSVVSQNKYSISVNETLHESDKVSEHKIDLFNTVRRGAREELGTKDEDLGSITFLALCASMENACWGMQGVIQTDKPYIYIYNRQTNHARDRREGKLIPIDFEVNKVAEFIKNHKLSWNDGARTCIYHTLVHHFGSHLVDEAFTKYGITEKL